MFYRRLAVIVNVVISLTRFSRGYLVYPPPGDFAPTKVQLILGLGLPMEVDVSMIIGYVMKFNYVLPYNATYLTRPYVRYDRSIERDIDEPVSSEETVPPSRWEVYEMLESLFGDTGTGKSCLLKTICEVADIPLNRQHGLAAQLLHVLLTPSTTEESFRSNSDREYRGAEVAGRENTGACRNFFPECKDSMLDYFTEIFYE